MLTWSRCARLESDEIHEEHKPSVRISTLDSAQGHLPRHDAHPAYEPLADGIHEGV